MGRFLLSAVLALGIGGLALLGEGSAAPPNQKQPNGTSTNYEMTVLTDVKVRLLHPPPEFDDKGKLKKYTAEEIKALKGEDAAERKLAGIKSDFAVLKPGDVVQVSFARPKDPTDLENTTFIPIGGQMSGRVVNVDAGTLLKSLTIRYSPNGVPQTPAGQGGKGKGKGKQGNTVSANTTIIKPETRQASVIVIVEQAPEPVVKAQKGKKKKQ